MSFKVGDEVFWTGCYMDTRHGVDSMWCRAGCSVVIVSMDSEIEYTVKLANGDIYSRVPVEQLRLKS